MLYVLPDHQGAGTRDCSRRRRPGPNGWPPTPTGTRADGMRSMPRPSAPRSRRETHRRGPRAPGATSARATGRTGLAKHEGVAKQRFARNGAVGSAEGAPFRHDERRNTCSRGRIGIGRRTDAVDEPQREGQRRRDRPVGHEQLAIEAPEGVAIASDRRARGSPARGIPNEIQPEQQVHPVATAIQFPTAVASLPDLWSGSTLALQTKRTTTPCRAPRTRS